MPPGPVVIPVVCRVRAREDEQIGRFHSTVKHGELNARNAIRVERFYRAEYVYRYNVLFLQSCKYENTFDTTPDDGSLRTTNEFRTTNKVVLQIYTETPRFALGNSVVAFRFGLKRRLGAEI